MADVQKNRQFYTPPGTHMLMESNMPGRRFMPLVPAESEDYADFIIKYTRNNNDPISYLSNDYLEIINSNYAVLYAPLEEVGKLAVNTYSYLSVPKYYTNMDAEGLNASGISQLQSSPYLNLKGEGTMIAVIDSGIDYMNPVFNNTLNATRIAYLWDQTISSDTGQTGRSVPYGTEYLREDIDRARASENPYEIVPSRDENGHGTFLAGIAAGQANQENNFAGAAPAAELIVVKLKQAKRYLREFYVLPEDAQVYQENDIMFGVQYAVNCARSLNRPLVICVGLGTNLGAHSGEGVLSQFLDEVSRYEQNAVVVPAGNEGNQRHHFGGMVPPLDSYETVELKIGKEPRGFVMEFWGEIPNSYEMVIITPTGEEGRVIRNRGGDTQTLRFVFVNSVIEVNHIQLERQSGRTLIFMRFLNPADGIWRFRIYSDNMFRAMFNMWLPVAGMISEETYFLQSSPDNTITNPGDASTPITMGAYDYRTNTLFVDSGRGALDGREIQPDITAPGVEMIGPEGSSRFVKRSGTSIAAAQTAGAAALLFEWAIVRNNAPYLNGLSVKYYLIQGADRSKARDYPNNEWGYGMLDLYGVFELLI